MLSLTVESVWCDLTPDCGHCQDRTISVGLWVFLGKQVCVSVAIVGAVGHPYEWWPQADSRSRGLLGPYWI